MAGGSRQNTHFRNGRNRDGAQPDPNAVRCFARNIIFRGKTAQI
jgi:hypothetical protein